MNNDKPYAVYVLIDDMGRIKSVESDAFLTDTTGWVKIDSGYGDKYHHAQGNYFPQPIIDERDILRYKLVDGVPVERTQAEMDADDVEPEVTPENKPSSTEERITELEEAMKAIEEGIASV